MRTRHHTIARNTLWYQKYLTVTPHVAQNFGRLKEDSIGAKAAAPMAISFSDAFSHDWTNERAFAAELVPRLAGM
jgi:hypothetical protein